jgi:hypothetical protein
MKEELQSKLVEILGSIQATASKAGDFAMTQLPEIAQQYVTYGRVYTATVAVIGVAVFASGFVAVRSTNKRHVRAEKAFDAAKAKFDVNQAAAPNRYIGLAPARYSYFEKSDYGPLPYVPFALGAVIFILNISQTLLVWFAPKVWLLKEIAELVK